MTTRTENMLISDNGNAWRGGSKPTFGRGASRGAGRVSSGPTTRGGGDEGAGPGFLRNRFNPISRERTGSIKRVRVDSDEGGAAGGQERGGDSWGNITKTMEKINLELEKVKNEGNGALIEGVMAGFKSLEGDLNGISDSIFDLYAKIDYLMTQGNQVNEFLDTNVAGGNISQELEKSKAYENLCKDMADSLCITKVYGVDLKKEVKGRDELIKVGKGELEQEGKIHLRGAGVIPLGRNSGKHEEMHTVPFLVVSKDKESKKTFEESARDRKYKTAFHWPKNLVGEISSIRSQLKSVKTNEIDLSTMDILIRPHHTGKSLTIMYRSSETRSGNWTFFESVKTPASADLVAKYKGFQPCQSKYFKI